LNYFLFTSLNGDTRKKGLTTFLTSYYDSFKEVFCAAEKPMKFTFEELVAEYRNKHMFGLLMALMVVPIVIMNPRDAPDFSEMGDGDIQEAMKEFQQKVLKMVDTNPLLKPRFLDMFDEMIEHGVLDA
jgi:hypothetical protein